MKISEVMQMNSCSTHMGRWLQTQNGLYSLTNPILRFSAPLWKVRLQVSVKKPDPWSLLPHQDFGESTLAELLLSLGFLFVGWKQEFPFSFVLFLFFFFGQSIQAPLATCSQCLCPATPIRALRLGTAHSWLRNISLSLSHPLYFPPVPGPGSWFVPIYGDSK